MLKLPHDELKQEMFYAALIRLKAMDEFKEVVKVLDDNVQRLNKANMIERDETIVRWRQGGLQVINKFLTWTEHARENIELLQALRRK